MPLPCPSGPLPNWTALDIRRASSNGTLHLISPSLHSPKKKKTLSLRSTEKKKGSGWVKKNEPWRQWRMLIANQYSVMYDWVSSISEPGCRGRHIAAICDMPHTRRTEPTSEKVTRNQPLRIYLQLGTPWFFFTQHAVVKAREAFFIERWEAKKAELRKPKFVQTKAFPESA